MAEFSPTSVSFDGLSSWLRCPDSVATPSAPSRTVAETIDSAVARATGTGISSARRLTAGEANLVYEVQTRAGRSVIVRISRSGKLDFEQEVWAIGRCLPLGVPAPPIRLVQHCREGHGCFSICVMDKLRGSPLMLNGRDTGGTDALRRSLAEVGSILGKIHSIPVAGFGWLNSRGEGRYRSLNGWVMEKVEPQRALRAIARSVELEPAAVDLACATLRSYQGLFTGCRPHLVHGDLSGKHLLVDNGTVTSVVDFGGVQGNHPLLDFANWDLFEGERFPVQWIMDGYPDQTIFAGKGRLLVQLLKLRLCLSLLPYYCSTANASGVEWVKRKPSDELGRLAV